jgi:hypothetical protein
MPAPRSVLSVLLRGWETFLYTLKAGPAGGRLRRPSSRRQRHDAHRASSLTPASKLLESHQGVARHPYRRMLGALTERGISSYPCRPSWRSPQHAEGSNLVGLALGL